MRSRAHTLSLVVMACLGTGLLASAARLAAQQKPIEAINQECTAFTMAPDGKIVYSVRHIFSKKPHKYDMERDDIWILESGGKRRRIVEGEKLVRGTNPFSYQVHELRFSLDGQRLVANLLTTEIVDDDGTTRDQAMALLLDSSGREIKIQGADSVIVGAENATWLADGGTVVYMLEEVKPRLLFTLNAANPGTGRGGKLFENTLFSAVAWLEKHDIAVAIERDAQLSRAPELVLLDLSKQTRKELAKLEDYAGGLSISPSGEKIAYFRDLETLEIREVAHPDKVTRVRALIGKYRWTADEKHLVVKPGPENKSDVLNWVSIADGNVNLLLHGLTYRDFDVSPDGKEIAVRIPGKGNIEVYPLP